MHLYVSCCTSTISNIKFYWYAFVSCKLILFHSCSLYSELSSSAKEDNSQIAIEQFLILHSTLISTRTAADSLSRAISVGSSPKFEGHRSSDEDSRVFAETEKQASSWIHAALATNLSSFSLYRKESSSASKTTLFGSQPIIVLENSNKNSMAKSTSPPDKLRPSVTSKFPTPSITQRLSTALASLPIPQPGKWIYGTDLNEAIDLADMIQVESQEWFLNFMENFLDSDVNISLLSDNDQIAGMLTQLRNVNSWLDKISTTDDNMEMHNSNSSSDKVDKLRKKIYEYVLTHVESAAASLGNSKTQSSRTAELKTRK